MLARVGPFNAQFHVSEVQAAAFREILWSRTGGTDCKVVQAGLAEVPGMAKSCNRSLNRMLFI